MHDSEYRTRTPHPALLLSACALQLWDLGTGAEMKTFEWPVGLVNKDPCLVYAAQFSPDGKLIAAGGSGG